MNSKQDHLNNENVLIVAPTGQDARLALELFRKAGIGAEIFGDLGQLISRLVEPAGVIFLAEEALGAFDRVESLTQALAKQEPWSDIPVLVMVSAQARGPSGQKVLDLFGPDANVSLIERPFHTVTLLSAVQGLLRARRRQYQVRHLLNELSQALQQRDEFVSIVTHELKNPLTSLKLQNQMSKRALTSGNAESISPAKLTSTVENADRQLNRLSTLIEDLLDVSRIRAGRLTLNPEESDLKRITERVLEQFAPQLASAGIPVEFKGVDQAVGLWDPQRIEQVITNLISNAIKYGGGKPIKVSIGNAGRCARLSVQDQGMGISPEDQERVFQRFERTSSVNKIAGLGLGLYIVRQIVEQHGGRIWVESELGRGSTFHVELPLKGHSEARAAI